MSKGNAKRSKAVETPVMRLWERPGAMALMWGLSMCLVSLLVQSLGLGAATRFYVEVPLVILISVSLLTIVLLSRSRLRRRVEISEGVMCLGCRHRLDPERASGRCPECGAAYDLSRVQRAWRREVAPVRPWRSPGV